MANFEQRYFNLLEGGFKEMKQAVSENTELTKKTNKKLDAIDKRVTRVEDEVKLAKRRGDISISKEAWNVLKWMLLIIGGLAGVKLI